MLIADAVNQLHKQKCENMYTMQFHSCCTCVVQLQPTQTPTKDTGSKTAKRQCFPTSAESTRYCLTKKPMSPASPDQVSLINLHWFTCKPRRATHVDFKYFDVLLPPCTNCCSVPRVDASLPDRGQCTLFTSWQLDR